MAPLRPRAVLLDLDDTIVSCDAGADPAWRAVCGLYASRAGGLDGEALFASIDRVRDWFWSDPERHRRGRADLVAATTEIVWRALADLEAPTRLADDIALDYRALRDEQIALIPGAVETLDWLREVGFGTALVTNGAARDQRAKLERFELARRFDTIWIEGERDLGKPEPEVYLAVLEALAVAPSEACFVGDHIEWDVRAPQALGVTGVWVNAGGRPATAGVPPDATIEALPELVPLLAGARSSARLGRGGATDSSSSRVWTLSLPAP